MLTAMNERSRILQAQAGVLLLEALIAILIFSLGILSLVALQATSIQLTSDAKYRTDATLLANRLIGRMWAGDRNATTLQTNYDSTLAGPQFVAWRDNEVRGIDGLPGVAAAAGVATSTMPVVIVTPAAATPPATVANRAQVDITLFWRTPEMDPAQRHQHRVVTEIVYQN